MALILNGTDGLSDVDGTAATPAIRGTDTNTGIFFPAADTIAFSEGGVESARFDSSGNLGIGTSSPSARLNVVGGGTNALIVAGGSGSTIRNTASAGSSWFVGTNADSYILHNESNTPMLFTTNGSERMRIDSSGNVIVSGTSTSSDDATYQGGGVFVSRRASSAGTTHASFLNGGSSVGSITSNTVNTFYNNTSDYRLKENVAPMTGALAKVQQLKPCTYTWKLNGSAGQGFIAHELQEVVPDCVSGEKDAVETYTDEDGNEQTRIKAQGIDTSFLVATLTAAIQELKAELDSVKATVDLLSTEVATLKGAV